MHPLFYEQVAAQRSRDLLREAASARLAHAVGPVRHPLIGRGLMGLGAHLVRWGARLADDCERTRLAVHGVELRAVADPRRR